MGSVIRRIAWAGALAGAVVLLWACGSVKPTQTTEEGYRIPSPGQARIALNEGLQAFNEACIVPDALGRGEDFPVTIVEPDTLDPPVRYRQLRALEDAGLLTNRRDTTSGGLMRRTFALTEDGQEVNREIFEFRGWQSSLCYATPRVTRVDSIYAVPDRSPRPLAEVIFHHALQEVRPWARRSEVRQLFPSIIPRVREVGTPTQSRRSLIETESGWTDSRLVGRKPPQPGGS
jgi:DNA-binding PadR family transcriptional regulator